MSEVKRPGRVGLLVTCLVDQFRPEAGFAAVRLLEEAGYAVEVPLQGCCGQPNFNAGDNAGARAMARRVIDIFEDFDYIVVPSGSCAAMLRMHYPGLFVPGSADHSRAASLAGRTWELTAFLHDVAGFTAIDAHFDGAVVLHDSCSALRELNVREQPRALLAQVRGCRVQALAGSDVCCGFGGLFCVKYPDISNRMAEKKIADLLTTGEAADTLVSTDLGCLLHLAGKLHRDGVAIDVRHIAELLAGTTDPAAGRKE